LTVNEGDDESRQIRQASAAILRYLDEHPLAADSINGVLSFWVGARAQGGSLAVVKPALELLTTMGRITQETLPGGEVLYRGARAAERG
jgi:hypothetical protein